MKMASCGTGFLITCLLLMTAEPIWSVYDPGTRLARILFNDYMADIIPNCTNELVRVKVGMALRGILDVDEPSQIVKVTVWLRMEWMDCRLAWNQTEHSLPQLVVSSDRIWIPDITLFDSTGQGLEGVGHYCPIIYPSGKVFFMAPAIIDFSCKLDVTYFPYDRQRCRIKFASWSHDGHEMDVTNRSAAGDTSVFVDNGEWNLLGVPVRRNVVYYPCCDEPYPDVTFYLVIQRQFLYYFFNLVMPCALISGIALLVFCLPPESGEKISLGITVLLSLCVFLLMVSERMPATSETIPLIARYFAATIVLASVSCGMTVIALNVRHRGAADQTVPSWVRTVVIRGLGKLLCIGPSKADPHNNDDEPHVLNPLLSPPLAINCNDKTDGRPAHTDVPASGNSRVEALMEEAVRLLRGIAQRFKEQDRKENVSNEWRTVAMVLDRLFFFIATILVVVVTVAILTASPDPEDWQDLSWADNVQINTHQ